MQNTEFTAEQFNALQSLYTYFNTELFGGQLNNCLLNLSRKSKAYGFFAPNRWGVQGDKANIHEISLNPEFLKCGVQETLQTLVHEMCHLWQQDHGKPSPGYHNKEWAAKMEEVGLTPSHNGQPGGKKTGKSMADYATPDGVFLAAVDRMPKEFLYPFVCIPEIKINKPSKNKTKYTCPCCASNIWGKDGLMVECTDCDTLFEKAA
jgi:hypothetical protein